MNDLSLTFQLIAFGKENETDHILSFITNMPLNNLSLEAYMCSWIAATCWLVLWSLIITSWEEIDGNHAKEYFHLTVPSSIYSALSYM